VKILVFKPKKSLIFSPTSKKLYVYFFAFFLKRFFSQQGQKERFRLFEKVKIFPSKRQKNQFFLLKETKKCYFYSLNWPWFMFTITLLSDVRVEMTFSLIEDTSTIARNL